MADTQWRDIATAPRDGTSILLFTTDHGMVEARYSEGYWSDDTPISPREYSGDAWVCGDDAWQIEVEEYGDGEYGDDTATHWMPLPPLPPPPQE